jgi:hypothetical protein
VLESLPFEQFHGDERLALLVANFVNGADARMVEADAARASRWNRSST